MVWTRADADPDNATTNCGRCGLENAVTAPIAMRHALLRIGVMRMINGSGRGVNHHAHNDYEDCGQSSEPAMHDPIIIYLQMSKRAFKTTKGPTVIGGPR
jgi:hypothetical protein